MVIVNMKPFILAISAAVFATPVYAASVSGTGTQPYACTVVGDPSITLLSNGQNQLTATGDGSVYQNNDTDYVLSAVTLTGPDSSGAATISATGSSLSISSTDGSGGSQTISGELEENVVYTISVSSTDGILTAGSYTASADLTCTAAP